MHLCVTCLDCGVQPESQSDSLESGMQPGRRMLVPDVRSSFVPVGQRYKMEAAHHTIASNQQVQQRKQKVTDLIMLCAQHIEG